MAHVGEYEAQPGRRPLTYDEVQALFDAADARAEEIRARGRKGALTALRDAALLKTVYAYGLRRREACGLDLADFRRNPKAAQFGRFGGLFVRYGKASRGGAPRRRTVLTVPEMDWISEVLRHWVDEVRPCLAPGSHPAVWVTERRGRIAVRTADTAFTAAAGGGRAARGAGSALPAALVYHPPGRVRLPGAVRLRAGRPRYAATTAIYTGVSDDYRNRLLRRSLERHAGAVGGNAMIRKMGVRWNLRALMADRGMFATSDLVPLLAERGVHLSREQVYRLVTAARRSGCRWTRSRRSATSSAAPRAT